MGKVIAVANQKGGVGKTTTCVNITASLVATKRRVLLIDCDPQGNSAMGSGVNKTQAKVTINEVFLGQATIEQAIVATSSGVDLVPSNGNLTQAEVRLLQIPEREFQLRKALHSVRDQYDFIFIDCPPSLNMLTVNSLVAADSVLIPIQCEYYALEGLTSLLSTIEQLRASSNPSLHVEGLLRTMYDGRSRLTQEVSAQLMQHFGEKVYRTVIPRNVRLAEAPSHGLPVMHYDRYCQGAITYLALAGEIARRRDKELAQQQLTDEV